MVAQAHKEVGITMRVLVTGGAGFIGANLVKMLIEKSYQVLVLDNLSAGNPNYLKNADLRFSEGLNLAWIEKSILDPDAVYNAVEWSDSVIHLAAQTSVVHSVTYPESDFSTNAIGSINLLDICRKLDTKRFVFASSNAAKQYNLSPYGASKRAAEGYCLAYHATYGLETVALRLANVYGAYSAHKNSVIARWFKGIMDKKEITIEGGEQTRDFIHVSDVCRAFIAALESDISGEIFQVGTGIETSIVKLAAIVDDQIGDIQTVQSDPRENDVKRSLSNISKIGLMLHWQPSIKLVDGLIDTWEWFNDNSSNLPNSE
jgi:UDP-glucose 4-epimerase